ncbi:MAG: hypothetical protein KU37_10080 [Sulfuricurvum sp. PC08-66]|nr:MAG: hypothetical protein KU37_10080 [Sulfuricurvum sp. PC08-66]
MKKNLVIVSGEIGQQFLSQMFASSDTQNPYDIIYYDEAITLLDKDNFTYHKFDPTSFSKISMLMKGEYFQALIVMDKRTDIEVTVSNIRAHKNQMRIILIDFWNIAWKDPNIVAIKSKEVLSNRMTNYLPDVPMIAQNVGLGIGEVMEVVVPFGSSYVYRHVSTIHQKNWKIVALYRNNQLIIATPNKMIQPNDRLLLIGEPSVLRSVNRAIKRQLGQFPAPFGKNLYLYLDIRNASSEATLAKISQARFLHQKFNHKLFIRVINPRDFALLEQIKALDNSEIVVVIDYTIDTSLEKIHADIELFNIGLIIVDGAQFAQKEYRKVLYDLRKPVLKLSAKSIEDLGEAIVSISSHSYVNRDLERISTAIYDVSAQLGLRITLFDFLQEESEQEQVIIEHFENLSAIFSKRFHVVKSDFNPIRSLRKRNNFLQCIPFNMEVLPRRWHSIFSTDMHKLYYKLDEYHQIFIPTKI